MAKLHGQLVGLTSDERATLKAKWFSLLPTRVFTRGLYTVTLSNFSVTGKVFSVFVVVTKSGTEVLRDTFRYVNPPILVPDGTFQQVIRNDWGVERTVMIPNMKEDLVEALKQMVMQTIKNQL